MPLKPVNNHDQISEQEAKVKAGGIVEYVDRNFRYNPNALGSEYIRTLYSVEHLPDGTSIIFHGSGEMPQ